MRSTTPEDVQVLVNMISVILHGEPPEAQGGALADLVAMFFAGHHPAMRDQAMLDWLAAVRDLVPINEKMLFKRMGGKPAGWETQ
jgi:hypothetical protein